MTVREIRFYAMGCHMMAAMDDIKKASVDPLSEVPGWFETWEQQLSRFRADSELSSLNRSVGQAFAVSPVLWEVYQAAVKAERFSQGWVTPTVYDAMIASGYSRSFREGLLLDEWEADLDPGPVRSVDEVQVNSELRTLTLPPGIRIDFGGIAKGWAADQALRRLHASGPALVDAGGDIAVGEPPEGESNWLVGVGEPYQSDQYREMLTLVHCGVATSGRDYRRWQLNGTWQHHLMDPHTGRPSNTEVISATVIAPTASEAEVAAKVVVLSGYQAGLEWLESQPGCEGIVALEDGRRYYSRHLEDYLWKDN